MSIVSAISWKMISESGALSSEIPRSIGAPAHRRTPIRVLPLTVFSSWDTLACPFASGSSFGMVFGVPVRFRAGNTVRLDSGGYIPIFFSDPGFFGLSIPFHAWFQLNDQFWLGPLTGIRFHRRSDAVFELGFGHVSKVLGLAVVREARVDQGVDAVVKVLVLDGA